MAAVESIYQRALGTRFSTLHPALRAYFGALPSGSVGVGTGVYAVAGSPYALVRLALRITTRRGILFPEFATDVPFTVVNIPSADGSLRGIRDFAFARGDRTMRDRMTTIGDGRIVDRVGDRGGLEVELAVDVVTGELRLTSGRLALRIAGRRIPLPRVARVTVHERAQDAGQHVDVRIRVPLLGEVFRYAGAFTYRHMPASEVDALGPKRVVTTSRNLGERTATRARRRMPAS